MKWLVPFLVIFVSVFLGWFVFSTNHPEHRFAAKLGLDLAGGTELIYRADTSSAGEDVDGALAALREVIERRVNVFGVAEPLVQTEKSSGLNGVPEYRLIVELPGVTDVDAAVRALGETPLLEFKLLDESGSSEEPQFLPTDLTGRYIENAQLQFGGATVSEPMVMLQLNEEGAVIFERITREHVGQTLAIFLDGTPISAPVIREAIAGGQASISGGFTPEEARDLVQNINLGALPVPVELIGSNTVGATLGLDAFSAGMSAAVAGFVLVGLFMIFWYRVPGVIATLALFIYALIIISAIKFIPITLTASGIAGLIISIGMAVDANVLIFERMKEELKKGLSPKQAARIGFSRSWSAIRDGHLTGFISAVILFWLGTSLVQGFALVFGLGILASLLTAVLITRIFIEVILPKENKGAWKFLLSSGFHIHS